MADVDIIVITYNAKYYLKRCLGSLAKNTAASCRLLIINNDSTDSTAAYLKKCSQVSEVINLDKNFGFSQAANIGIKRTVGKYIAFIDDDAEVPKGWLPRLKECLEENSRVGIAGCKIVGPDERIFCADYRVAPPRTIGAGEIDRGQRNYTKPVDAVAGTCWLMRRKIIDKVGYFDERFFPCQHEDLDYCLRTRLAGYRIIYNGRVKIIHQRLRRDGGYLKKNNTKFLKKWARPLSQFPLKDSPREDFYISQGINHLFKNNFRQAVSAFKRAEALDGRLLEPFYMGAALEGAGQYKPAVGQFKKAVYFNPSNIRARYRLGFLYKKMGFTREARREFSKVLGLIHSKSKNSFSGTSRAILGIS